MAAGNNETNVTDREIVTTRLLSAPRELVWQAWTDPKHVAQWWGPNGFTNTIHEMSVAPGGIWLFDMHGPDGRDYPNKIVFHEVVRPERLVYDHGEPGQPGFFHTKVTFADEGGKTRITMRALFATAQERDHVVREYGAIEGANQTLGRLEAHLKIMSGTPDMRGEVTFTRLIDAPPALVFKMWTEAQYLAQWWGPKGFTNPACEVDPRPGGALRIVMRAPDGTEYPMDATFREVVPDKRLVFTNIAQDPAGHRALEAVTTVIFSEERGKTKLTVHSTAVALIEVEAQYLQGMEEGWKQSLDKLSDFVARSLAQSAG